MYKSVSKLKLVHFFICWLLTVVIGSLFAAIYGNDLEFILLFMAVSAIVSFPFLIVFLILSGLKLKQNPTKKELHAFVFLVHLIGSLPTVLTLILLFAYDMSNAPSLVATMISGYFLIDTLLFHSSIALFYHQKSD